MPLPRGRWFAASPRLVRGALAVALLASALTLIACGETRSEPTVHAVMSATIGTQAPAAAAERVHLTMSSSTKYYAVTGTTTDDLFSSIDQNGPRGAKGELASGLTSVEWTLNWTRAGSAAACTIADMTINATTVVTLPQLDPRLRLPSDLAARWEKFAASVARHEGRHVEIAQQGAEAARQRMVAIASAPAECGALQNAVERAWDEQKRATDQQQEQFHAEEEVRIRNMRAPIEARMQEIRARRTETDSRLAQIDADLASMKREIDDIDQQLASIQRTYPVGIPDVARSRVKNLNDRRAPIVDQYNSTIPTRNSLAQEYNALGDELAQLHEDYQWAQ